MIGVFLKNVSVYTFRKKCDTQLQSDVKKYLAVKGSLLQLYLKKKSPGTDPAFLDLYNIDIHDKARLGAGYRLP